LSGPTLTPKQSLAYFYTRSLIHRPLVCYGSGKSASASVITLADSAKHMAQILELLDERKMNYTFPFNKSELLLTAGLHTLWQTVELAGDSKLIKDHQKTLSSLLDHLMRDSPNCGVAFQAVVTALVPIARRPTTADSTKSITMDTGANRLSASMPAPPAKQSKSTRKQLQAIAARFPPFSKTKSEDPPRRATVPPIGPTASSSPDHRTWSSVSLASTRSAPVVPVYSPAKQSRMDLSADVHLDYLPFDHEAALATPVAPASSKPQMNEAAWEQLLSNFDNGYGNIYRGIYGGGAQEDAKMMQPTLFDAETPQGSDWSHMACGWTASAMDLAPSSRSHVPRSVLSFSDESLSSGDDLVFSTSGSNSSSTAPGTAPEGMASPLSPEAFKGILIPNMADDLEFEGYDVKY